jgi:hypothetical protein
MERKVLVIQLKQQGILHAYIQGYIVMYMLNDLTCCLGTPFHGSLRSQKPSQCKIFGEQAKDGGQRYQQ